jgi:hypothetical protein
MDNVSQYVGRITDPEREVPPDPPDGSVINGRATVDDDEARIVSEARAQERAAGAAMVAGIGRGR